MATSTQLVCHRKRRIDMTGSAAGRDDEVQGMSPFERYEQCTP